MNSKRLWATTATIFALSVFGPRSSGVWAATRAMCLEGWEWVRSVHTFFWALTRGLYTVAEPEFSWARPVRCCLHARRQLLR